MRNFRSLIRVFNRDLAYEPPQDKVRRMQLKFLAAFAAIFIMIPVAVGSGLFTYLMTKSLIRAGHGAFGLTVMYHLISVFTMVFGINVIFNELYFANDLPRLLPLPIRGRELAGAKFAAAFRNENIIQFIIILSCTIGYGIAAEMPIWRWIFALSFGLFLSLIPMLYCGILGIFLMSFTRVVKSKDTVRRISIIFMLVVLGLAALALTTLKKTDVDSWIVGVASQDIPFVRIMNVVFAENYFLVEFMQEGSISGLLFFLLINAALIGVFVLVAEKFYLNSISRLGEGEHRAKHGKAHAEQALKGRTPLRACMVKEWKILRRTPVFFTNCILVTMIWVVFAVVAGVMTGIGLTPPALHERYAGGESGFALGVMVFSGAITMIMGSMNCLGSNAFSREGRHFEVMQFLPIDPKVHWNAKGYLGTLITAAGTAPFFIFFGIYAGLPVHHTILMVLLSAASAFGVTYLGLFMDSINPKLLWEDALTALRENYNTFFCMAIAIGIAGVMAGIGVLLFVVLKISVAIVGCVLLAAVLLFDFLIYRKCMGRGIENIKQVINQ